MLVGQGHAGFAFGSGSRLTIFNSQIYEYRKPSSLQLQKEIQQLSIILCWRKLNSFGFSTSNSATTRKSRRHGTARRWTTSPFGFICAGTSSVSTASRTSESYASTWRHRYSMRTRSRTSSPGSALGSVNRNALKGYFKLRRALLQNVPT
jgi:hypothetical protein